MVLPTPLYARVCWYRTNIFWFMVCQNGILNQFSHSLLIEIPSRDSLLARTDINSQDRQESAVGVVSAVSAVTERLCWTAQATRTTAAAARHSPRGRRCGSGRWAPPEREAGAIRLQKLAGELLAWGERARLLSKRVGNPHALQRVRTRRSPKLARDPHADKQTIAFNGARNGGLHKLHRISFGYGQTILLYAQAQKREQYKVARSSS
jgi:hypothetical protein